MKTNRLIFLIALLFSLNAGSQQIQRPKLVIGIVVDQMRPDYLFRYYDRFGNNGFRRLLREGFNCENTFIPHTPTYTSVGHACIYTGTVPAFHGIMGNYWYDRLQNKVVYCTDDSSAGTVGSHSTAGKMSPVNMWSNTITDELRLATNFTNKTIAIALKDRGSILPGGHSANAAYWFDNANGGWISSTHYMSDLPEWMKAFNARKLPDTYLKQNWQTLNAMSTYKQSTTDDKVYEDNLPGEDRLFPHVTDSIRNNRYESFRYTPAANTYTFETAKAAIQQEKLGQRNVTDFLALSFSSPDYIGHVFGPNSIEVEDMYMRFDQDLAQFLQYLDNRIGKGQYLLFLTADHGVAHMAGFNKEHRLPGGTKDDADITNELNEFLKTRFNSNGLISSVINYQVYLNRTTISQQKLDEEVIKNSLIDYLVSHPSILAAVDLKKLQTLPIPDQLKKMMVNGYNQKLSGDIQFVLKPQWYDRWSRGTTHGGWYAYDAHIPLLWFGWKVKPGRSNREVYMSDIAATLAALLHIQMPNASVGKVIEEVVR